MTGVGAQAQIDAKDIAVGGVVVQHRRHLAGGADEGLACIVPVGAKPVLVEQADQVDVRGIVQLGRAHLAHGKDRKPCGRLGIGLCRAGQTATGNLGRSHGAEGQRGGQIGKGGQRASDALQRPHAPKVGQCRQQRHPALGHAQGRA